MLSYKEVGSEPRPVLLHAELRAQPSPGAGGQLALLQRGIFLKLFLFL